MSIAPYAEFSELLYFGMGDINLVLHGKTLGVKDAYVTAEPEEYTGSFECH